MFKKEVPFGDKRTWLKLGMKPSHITQILRGRNITIRTLARIVFALDGEPKFTVVRVPIKDTSIGTVANTK